MMSATISPAQFEWVESETWADFTAAAPAAAQRALGTARLDIGGGVALTLPNDPTGFWNMTRGLGFAEPVTADLVQRVAAFYREHGASAARLHLPPQVLPPDWPDICARLNISDSGEVLVKLGGSLATVTERSLAAVRLDPGLRIGRVGPDQAREFAEVTWKAFQLPPKDQAEMAVGAVGRPGWQQFAVFEGSAIVAAAGLRVCGDVGYLFGGATLERARRRGAQSALIAARAVAAYEAGGKWLIAETGAERPGERNPSLRNMERAGMAVGYQHQTWVWRAPGGSIDSLLELEAI
jgi:hypothetical protein